MSGLRLNSLVSFFLVLTIALFPLDQILLAIGLGTISRMTVFFGIFFILAASLQGLGSKPIYFDANIKIKSSFCLFVLFIAVAFISIFFSFDQDRSIVKFSQMIFLFTLSLFVFFNSKGGDLRTALRSLVFFCSAACLLIFLLYPQFFLDPNFLNRRLDFERLSINSIAMMLSACFILTMMLYSLERKNTIKMLLLICMATYLFLIIRTGTRSTIIGIPVALLLSGVVVYKVEIFKKLKWVFFTVPFLLIFGYLLLNSGLLAERIVDRLIVDSGDFLENARVNIWATSLSWYADNLIGSGIGYEKEVLNGLQTESHNTFISVLVETSVFGFLFFLSSYILLGISLLKDMRNPFNKFYALAIYLFFTMQMLKGTMHTSRLFWFFVMWVLFIYVTEKNLSREKYKIGVKENQEPIS